MAEREVVVNLKLGDTQAVAKFEELTSEMKKLALEKSALNREIKSLDKEFRALQKTEQQLGKTTPELTAAVQSNRKAFDDATKNLARADLQYENLRVQYREMKNDLSGATQAKLRFRDVMVEAIRTGVAPMQHGMESLQMSIRVVRQEATKAFQEFGAGSEEFKRASKILDDLEDKMVEFNAASKLVDIDGKFELAAQAAAGAASAFSAVQGALALIGTESQEVEQAMLRVQGAIALATGLQGVAKMAKEFKGIAAALGLVETGATAAAGGVKILGLTLTSTGIGVAIAAVGALAAALVYFTSQTEEATRTYEQFRSTLESGIRKDTLDEELAVLRTTLALEKEKAKGAQADVKVIAQLEKDLSDKRADYITAQVQGNEKLKQSFKDLQLLKEAALESDREAATNADISVKNEEALKKLRIQLGLEESATLLEINRAYYDAKDAEGIRRREFEKSQLERQLGDVKKVADDRVKIETDAGQKIIEQVNAYSQFYAKENEEIIAGQEEFFARRLEQLAAYASQASADNEAVLQSEEEFNARRIEQLNTYAASFADVNAQLTTGQEGFNASMAGLFQDFATSLGGAFDQIFQDQASAQKKIILSFIEFSRSIVRLSLAQLFAKEIASKSFAGLATFAALSALAEATFSAAKSAAMQGFESGGYTPRRGSDSAPVGVVHANEWVASAPLVREWRPLFDWLDQYQRTGRAPMLGDGFQTGGFVPQPSPQQLVQVEQIAETRAIDFSPVVRVTDINDVQDRVAVIDNLTSA